MSGIPLGAGLLFVLLYVILGVALWVSFLVVGVFIGAAAAGVGAGMLAGGRRTRHTSAVRLNPITDVSTLRHRFFLSLALALGAGFLVVESFAFTAGVAGTIGWAVGIPLMAMALLISPTLRRARSRQVVSVPSWGLRLRAWDLIAAVSVTLGGWQIVQALVFSATTAKWLTFADALGLLGVAVGALALHEVSTERVVYSLEVTGHTHDHAGDGGRVQQPAAERPRQTAGAV